MNKIGRCLIMTASLVVLASCGGEQSQNLLAMDHNASESSTSSSAAQSTPAPTETPTIAPTNSPTSIPTASPTNTPTMVPTIVATPISTPETTPAPTPVTTPIPSTTPTAIPLPEPGSKLDRTNWLLDASHNADDVYKALDGDDSTRWTTKTIQAPDQWIVIDFNEIKSFDQIVLASESSAGDYPRSYEVYVSSNGKDWGNPIATGTGTEGVTTINFDTQQAQFVYIYQTSSSDQFWWSIHELDLFYQGNGPTTPTPTPTVSPTMVVTPVPTAVPTAVPTPVPTTAPTPIPIVGNAQNGETDFSSLGCIGCHNISINQRNIWNGTEASIIATAINNIGGMALFKDADASNGTTLSDQQLADVAAYIADYTAMPTPEPTPSPTSSPTPVPTDLCDDMQALMQTDEMGCTNSGCHGATPSQAAKISLTGTIDEVAARLANADSVSSNCSGEKVIDVVAPSDSLLLKLVDPNSGDQCAQKMPLGSHGVSEAHFQCFKEWVDDIVFLADIPEEPTPQPFEPATPFSAVNKVKQLLHGGAVTDDEFAALTVDGISLNQDAFKTQIQQWMTTEEFEKKFKAFLSLALQQKTNDGSWRQQFDGLTVANVVSASKIIANMEQSFVRTAYKIFEEQRDYRTIATTRDWEVTTAMMLALAYADYTGRFPFRDDDGFNPLKSFPYLCGDNNAGEGVDETDICNGIDDYTDWRTVHMTQSSTRANYEISQSMVEDLRAIGNGDSYALKAPRVGFFTTPAFFQVWESNVGNIFRVTVNQAMITGVGLTFEAGDTTPSGDQSGVDEAHAGPDNAECYACHRMMDPMRQIYSNYYEVSRSRALETVGTTTAAFAFHGGEGTLDTLDDFGQAIYDHPNFANAWVGKLCNWANSTSCDTSSTEFKRLVNVFKDSGYNMKTLVVEMFASPLTTGVEYTDAFEDHGLAISLNRKNHFCETMKTRLDQVRASQGLPASSQTDICNLTSASRNAAALLPEDEFSRGTIDLIQSVKVDPFLVVGYKQLCASISNRVVSYGAGIEGNANYERIFSAQNSNISRSLDEMTTYIMGIPPAHDSWTTTRAALQKLYDITMNNTSCADAGLDIVEANADSVQCGLQGANNATGLREVWTFACSSPAAMGMGF